MLRKCSVVLAMVVVMLAAFPPAASEAFCWSWGCGYCYCWSACCCYYNCCIQRCDKTTDRMDDIMARLNRIELALADELIFAGGIWQDPDLDAVKTFMVDCMAESGGLQERMADAPACQSCVKEAHAMLDHVRNKYGVDSSEYQQFYDDVLNNCGCPPDCPCGCGAKGGCSSCAPQ